MNKKFIKKMIACLVTACTICTSGIAYAASANDSYNKIIVSNPNLRPNENGYVFGNVAINGGGYVTSIIFNKSEKGLYYMRTDMGGAYRWNPDTNRWVPLCDWVSAEDWNLLGCESIATDPIDTNRLYIAAGTYTTDWTDQNGYILRSTDKGETFDKIELPFKCGGNMAGRNMGERLNIDPNDNSVLYMGARSGKGLWKSEDYGSTWNKVESFPSVGTFTDDYNKDPLGIVWEVFDPTSSEKGQPCQTIYVGVANKGKEETIFVTKDGGKTWSPVEGQPTYEWTVTKDRPGNYIPGRAALGSNGMLYISYTNQEGPYNGNHGGVWKYDTKNNEWTDITPVKDSDWGYGGMTVDASDPNIIMTTTLNCYNPDGNIYRSTDGGETWNSFWEYNQDKVKVNNYSLDYSEAPWLDWSKEADGDTPSPKLGWMLGDINIDPFDSNHVVYGTGATLYSCNNVSNLDLGKRVNINLQINGVEETAVLDLVSPPSGAELLSGISDIGGFVHTDINKAAKMPTNPGISNCTSIDYAELNPEKIVRVGDEAMVGLSNDGGKTWIHPSGKITIDATNANYQEVGGNVAMSANGKTILYSTGGNDASVIYSHNDGQNWYQSEGIPANAKVVSDRVNPEKFYGIAGGACYVSEDGGETFKKTAEGLPTDRVDLNAMPGVEGDIWFACEGKGMWHSTDGGNTFEKLSNVESAKVMGFGKAAPGKDYMALFTLAKINGKTAIYRSDDKGASWVMVNDDKHQYGGNIYAITGDRRVYGRCFIGTNGRGIVCAELADSNN